MSMNLVWAWLAKYDRCPESGELEKQASRFAEEIKEMKELDGGEPSRIR